MEQTEIIEKLTPIFRKALKLKDLVLTDDLKPDDVETWDSLANMTIVAEVQDIFGVKFSLKEMINFINVGSLVEMLNNKILK